MSALLTTRDLWYVSRGSGLVLFAALSADVALGVALRKGAPLPGLPRFATERLHRELALLAGLLCALHVVTAVLDPYAGIGWLASVVPMASPYRPVWIGFGAVALDLGLAVVLTSLLRAHLPHPAWKGVHFLVYLAWPLVLLHSLWAGSDLRLGLVSGTIWACTALVAVAVVWRIVGRPARPAAPRRRPHHLGTAQTRVTPSPAGHGAATSGAARSGARATR